MNAHEEYALRVSNKQLALELEKAERCLRQIADMKTHSHDYGGVTCWICHAGNSQSVAKKTLKFMGRKDLPR